MHTRSAPRLGARSATVRSLRRVVLRRVVERVGDVFGIQLGRLLVLTTDGLVHFLAMNLDRSRRGDAESHLVAANVDDGNLDVAFLG